MIENNFTHDGCRKLLVFSAALLVFFSLPLRARGWLALAGGGSEKSLGGSSWSDKAYRRILELSPRKNVVILSLQRETEWLAGYFSSLGASRVTDLQVDSREQADSHEVCSAIASAGLVFIKGGDQAACYKTWKGSGLASSLQTHFLTGGAVAGTSAGAMLLSEFLYSAEAGSLASFDALRNPFHQMLTIRDDFLALLPEAIVDTHFTQRGRLGRLVAFLARIATDRSTVALGIGIDDCTALLIGPDGLAEVFGEGSVTLLKRGPRSELRAESSRPLHFTFLELTVLTEGFRIDLATLGIAAAPINAIAVETEFTREPFRFSALVAPLFMALPEKAGDAYVENPGDPDALYYGKLRIGKGHGLLPGMALAENPFSREDESENLVGGLLLALHQQPGLYAVLAEDNLELLWLFPNRIVNPAENGSPLLVIDSTGCDWTARSQYLSDPDSSPFPRQSVALSGCQMHLIAPGYEFRTQSSATGGTPGPDL